MARRRHRRTAPNLPIQSMVSQIPQQLAASARTLGLAAGVTGLVSGIAEGMARGGKWKDRVKERLERIMALAHDEREPRARDKIAAIVGEWQSEIAAEEAKKREEERCGTCRHPRFAHESPHAEGKCVLQLRAIPGTLGLTAEPHECPCTAFVEPGEAPGLGDYVHPSTCSRCGIPLVFSARQRGNWLCGPCTRGEPIRPTSQVHDEEEMF